MPVSWEVGRLSADSVTRVLLLLAVTLAAVPDTFPDRLAVMDAAVMTPADDTVTAPPYRDSDDGVPDSTATPVTVSVALPVAVSARLPVVLFHLRQPPRYSVWLAVVPPG